MTTSQRVTYRLLHQLTITKCTTYMEWVKLPLAVASPRQPRRDAGGARQRQATPSKNIHQSIMPP